MEELVEVQVDPVEPCRVLKIRKNLESGLADQLINFLKKNMDVFTWTYADMVEIHPDIMSYKLNINPQRKISTPKVKGTRCKFYQTLQKEVDRLLNIGFIRESFYPDYLFNLVLVPKPNGKWRTCTDFTNLNKVCLKDSFPLPRIN